MPNLRRVFAVIFQFLHIFKIDADYIRNFQKENTDKKLFKKNTFSLGCLKNELTHLPSSSLNFPTLTEVLRGGVKSSGNWLKGKCFLGGNNF